jgi:predicted DsbA family dithiol-disulfide isomerase
VVRGLVERPLVTMLSTMDAAAVPRIVDVVSDVACPWCYIGKRRLEAALSLRRDDGPVKVRWHPFQLNPELPLGGMDRRKYLTEKFGGPERIKEAHERIAAVGQEVGIWFDFGRIERQPNTLNAHRLITWAQKRDPATATLLVERLFRAFFIEGVDIGNIGELVRLAGDVQLDRYRTNSMLASGEGSAQVIAADQRARSLGVGGVPLFIFNQRLAVSGAQPVKVLLDALAQSDASVAAR